MNFNQLSQMEQLDYLSDLLANEIFNFGTHPYNELLPGQQLTVKQGFHESLKDENIQVTDFLIQAVENEFTASPMTSFLLEYVALNDTNHERTDETKAINAALKIVKLSNQKFIVPGGYIIPKGYTLYHPTFGYFGFKGDGKPYTPAGGKKALQSILTEGGLLDFTDSVWWMEKI
ncbi:hypothetical protein GRF59_15100 [Paenibacillus sp. HJL G12]|uniref:Uncharacterized protein n=1 Tax=Paenibacillus dendrobii TaxID=2691084 RepID=A0A7X3LIU2_9BACL|nr:hypothetical protein [Paenibacillus dendrobii]MWV44948.1 hypothetical protein [Paenibacillus dendrobii]